MIEEGRPYRSWSIQRAIPGKGSKSFGISNTLVQPQLRIWRIANVVYPSENNKTGNFAMSQNPEAQVPHAPAPSLTTCSNCHSPMPSELRFCRNCGFRLGEGLAEYTQTVRFGDTPGGLAPGAAVLPVPPKKRKRMSGMAWIFVALLVFFVGAAAFTAIIQPIRQNARMGPIKISTKPKAFAGVDDFRTAENGQGVTFESVSAPDSPADKAGLVGGDIITKFDGQDVRDEDRMTELMEQTPIGKTVDVEYISDGENKKTTLTTISREELNRLNSLFDKRPEGKGQFGYDDDEVERVQIPNTKIYGVRLNRISRSLPADMAGIKNGDIITKFGDIPIRTTEELLMRVHRAIPYTTVEVTVMRGEGDALETIVIPVKMGRR